MSRIKLQILDVLPAYPFGRDSGASVLLLERALTCLRSSQISNA